MAALDFSQLRGLAIPEGNAVKIEINGTVVWKAGPTNQVPLSINESGGIYNGTGYKNGYRIRSGGAEGAGPAQACTGFIKVSPGDVIRFSGWEFKMTDAMNCINVANASFVNTGQFTMQPTSYGIFQESAYAGYGPSSVVKESDNVWKWVVPPAASGVAYIRVTALDPVANSTGATTAIGKDMIVTINEEIT